MNQSTPAPAASIEVRGLSLQRRLLLMALSLIVPAVVLMGLLLAEEYRQGVHRFEEQLIATTRALVLANDRQLAQGDAILRTLRASPALQRGDLQAFDEQARQAVAGSRAWIVLSSGDAQLLNTLLRPGAALPKARLPDATWRALRNGETVVSNLATGSVVGRPIIAVDKPAASNGKLVALSYIQEPTALRSIFTAQRIPATWVASIVDRNGVLVARSRDQDRFMGGRASHDMRAAMAAGREGMVKTQSLDGTPTLSVFSRSPAYGWAFVVGVPRAEFSRSAIGSAWLVALAAGALLAIGAGLAIAFARGISRETRTLMEDARALVSGGTILSRPRDLWETAQVRRALQDTSGELLRRQRENDAAYARQQLMINELNHRVKNTLATVQSLARQSLGSSTDVRVEAFTERLMALARAHDLLTERVWEGAELTDVIRRTLEPYGARADIEGPAIGLTPNTAVSLSMVFHELATNASKYGALSHQQGSVEVRWVIAPEGDQLRLTWLERGGPAVKETLRTGFGSRLIKASVTRELDGSVEIQPRSEGLVCIIQLPLAGGVSAIGSPPAP